MTTLRIQAKEYVPLSIDLDAYVTSVLQTLSHYYIKGGKAFNYYYATRRVPTSDWDIIATNETCSMLFDAMSYVFGKVIRVETYEPFTVASITQQDRTYQDTLVDGTQEMHHVRTIECNGIGIIDAIIVDDINETMVEKGTNGLLYLNQSLLHTDIEETVRDRTKKVDEYSLVSKSKRKKRLISKLLKSKLRLSIIKDATRLGMSFRHSRKIGRRKQKKTNKSKQKKTTVL